MIFSKKLNFFFKLSTPCLQMLAVADGVTISILKLFVFLFI